MDGVVGDREEGMDRVMGRDGWSDSGWGGMDRDSSSFHFLLFHMFPLFFSYDPSDISHFFFL